MLFRSLTVFIFLVMMVVISNLFCVYGNAQTPCIVTDPTGTPLNIRETPNGRIVASLPNGHQIVASDYSSDNRGKRWAYVVSAQAPSMRGWVFSDYITCRLADAGGSSTSVNQQQIQQQQIQQKQIIINVNPNINVNQ